MNTASELQELTVTCMSRARML